MSGTNTYTSAPTCENCGRDKQATYICDPCCDKLNAMHRDLRAERDRLAAENTELRGKLDDVRMGIGCARGQRTTQYCAEAAQRDDVITKLLDLTAPHVDEFGNRQWWQYKRPEQMHARACEIAGRTE